MLPPNKREVYLCISYLSKNVKESTHTSFWRRQEACEMQKIISLVFSSEKVDSLTK